MTQQRPLSSVAIAGHGLEAWLLAVRLLRAWQGRLQLTVCAVEGSDRQDERYAVLPMEQMNCALLPGIKAHQLVRECDAALALGTRFELPSSTCHAPYGPIGLDWAGSAFHLHWARLKASKPEQALAYHDWSAGSRAMKQNRFAPPAKANAIGDLQHAIACHVDTALLTRSLRNWALKLGAREAVSMLGSVTWRNDRKAIEGLHCGADQIAADLYIDCTGPQRALQNPVRPTAEQLRCTVESGRQQPLPSFSTVHAQGACWKLEVPRASSTLSLAFDPRSMGDSTDVGAWQENVLAMGSAAAAVLPLEGMAARYLALSIDQLLALMPAAGQTAVETRQYNRILQQELIELRKWQSLLVSGDGSGDRPAGPRLALFQQRGWIMPTDGQLLKPRDWAALFIMLGIEPGQQDRLGQRLPGEKLQQLMQQLDQSIDRLAAEFPSHDDYINAVLNSGAHQNAGKTS